MIATFLKSVLIKANTSYFPYVLNLNIIAQAYAKIKVFAGKSLDIFIICGKNEKFLAFLNGLWYNINDIAKGRGRPYGTPAATEEKRESYYEKALQHYVSE